MTKLHKYIYIPCLLLIFACSPTNKVAQQSNQRSILSAKDRIKNNSLFVDAVKEKNIGNITKATKLFEESIKVDPNDAASLYELSGLYLNQNRYEEAENLAKKAVQINPQNEWYRIMLSNAYKLNAKINQSNLVLAKLVEEKPDNLNYAQELVIGYVMTENYSKAIEIINQVENKTGLTEQTTMQKQQLYLKLNMIAEAVHEIEKLVSKYPYESRYYAILAELCLNNNLDDKALLAYQKIVEIDPENAYIHISLFDFYRKKGDRDKAVEELKEGLRNKNLDVDSKLQFVFSFYSNTDFYVDYKSESQDIVQLLMDVHPENLQIKAIYADLIYRDQKYDEALKIVYEVLAEDSTQYGYWELELLIFSAKQEFESLVVKSQIVMDKFPQQSLPYLLSGIANFQLQKFQPALDNYLRGQKMAIGNTQMLIQFFTNIGDTQHELGNIQAAYDSYESVLKLEPENSIVLNNFAYYLSVDNGDLDRALKMASKAVELDPYNSSNLDTKAWVLFKLAKYREAQDWIEKAIKLDGDANAEVLEHYGDILFKLGNIEEAVENWTKAKKIGEGSPKLDQKIKARKINE